MQKEQSQRNVCKASLAVFYKFYKLKTGLRVLNFCSSIEQKKKTITLKLTRTNERKLNTAKKSKKENEQVIKEEKEEEQAKHKNKYKISNRTSLVTLVTLRDEAIKK